MQSEKEKLEAELYAKTRRYSIKEGVAASVMGGVGDSYLIPYALELGAKNIQVGFLSSVAGLLGPLIQVIGSRLIETYSRKKIVFFLVLAHAASWLLFFGLGLWYLLGDKNISAVYAFIAIYFIYVAIGSLPGPAWFSLIGEAVPFNIRGVYFSKRNRICGFINISSMVLASFWLAFTRDYGKIIIGFMVLFFIAAIARFISAYFFSKHYVRPIELKPDYYFSFYSFIKKSLHNNFGRFTIYVAVMNFSISLAGPFYAVYMWKDLGFNPIWFTIVSASTGIFSVLFMPFWGRFADRYGNREALKISSFILIPAPFLWLFSNQPLYFALVPQMILGLAWSGFTLSTSNFIYDSVSEQRRGICVAYYNVINGLGVFLGAGLGGIISQFVKLNSLNIFLLIFIISGLLRLLAMIFFLPIVKEISPRHPVKANPLRYFRDVKLFRSDY